MWKSTIKAVKHNLADQVVELKDDQSLFACMLIVARSRSEINLKEAIGQHEFTPKPPALFTMTGDFLPCTDKSKLLTILEELPNQKRTGDDFGDTDQQPKNTTIKSCPLPTKNVMSWMEWQ